MAGESLQASVRGTRSVLKVACPDKTPSLHYSLSSPWQRPSKPYRLLPMATAAALRQALRLEKASLGNARPTRKELSQNQKTK
jgi:hypothetical protein